MLTYEEYAKIRDSKGMRDSDVSRLAGVNPTTFSEWKKGKATPKYEKMTKIERALGIVYLYTEGDYGVIEDPAPAALRDDEADILKVYNSLNVAGKKELLKLAKMVASQDEYMLKGDGSQSSDAV